MSDQPRQLRGGVARESSAEDMGSRLDQQSAYFRDSPLVAALLDAMPSGVLILNKHRETVYYNRHLEVHVGVDEAVDALGKRPGDLWGCVHASTFQGCGTAPSCNYCGAAKALVSAIRGEPAVAECSVTSSSGSRIDLRVWARPLSFAGHSFTVFVFDDIGDERRRQALEHIFFHDVLNTAGTISGAARLLDAVDPTKQPELTQMIVSNAGRMIDEVEAQRDLLAAETGELAFEPAATDSVALLVELAAAYATHPVARERQIVVADDAAALRLVTDRRLLGRVIGNLVKNALEASAGEQAVTLSCGRQGDAARFTVHNPSHMQREVKAQIFDRTFSTKGPGRGLGTRSVKLLTERYLGGAVGFRSEPALGTTFWVDIPLEPPAT